MKIFLCKSKNVIMQPPQLLLSHQMPLKYNLTRVFRFLKFIYNCLFYFGMNIGHIRHIKSSIAVFFDTITPLMCNLFGRLDAM